MHTSEHFCILLTPLSEINQFIVQADSSSSSPFHLSHSSTGTDVRVHPPPSDDDGEPNSKRRRVGANGDAAANDTTFARLPSVVHANQQLVKVHEFLKKECEELAKNCVSLVKHTSG
jgi:proteasome activator subunit 3 (PA28 gamma)